MNFYSSTPLPPLCPFPAIIDIQSTYMPFHSHDPKPIPSHCDPSQTSLCSRTLVPVDQQSISVLRSPSNPTPMLCNVKTHNTTPHPRHPMEHHPSSHIRPSKNKASPIKYPITTPSPSLPKPPKPLDPQRRHLNPPQIRHALTPPPLTEIVTLRNNQKPLRQRPPTILRPHPPINPQFLRILRVNLLPHIRHSTPNRRLRNRRQPWRHKTAFSAHVEAHSTANTCCWFLEMLRPLQGELKRERAMRHRARRRLAVRAAVF